MKNRIAIGLSVLIISSSVFTSCKAVQNSNKTQRGSLVFTGYVSGSPVGYMTARVGVATAEAPTTWTWHQGLDFSEITTIGRYVKYRIDFSSSFPNQVLYMKEPVTYKESDIENSYPVKLIPYGDGSNVLKTSEYFAWEET